MERRYVVTQRRRTLLQDLRRDVSDLLSAPGQRRCAWCLAWVLLGVGGSVGQAMTSHHVAQHRVVGICFLFGVVGGCAWQWLNRRDLVDRFAILGMLVVVAGVVAVFASGWSLDVGGASTAVGLLAGNVVLEWWLRLPRQRERYGTIEAMHLPYEPWPRRATAADQSASSNRQSS